MTQEKFHRLSEEEVIERYAARISHTAQRFLSLIDAYRAANFIPTLEEFSNATVQAHRKPTAPEISSGNGAVHYKEFPLVLWVHPKTGEIKQWIKCEYDGLRYYR